MRLHSRSLLSLLCTAAALPALALLSPGRAAADTIDINPLFDGYATDHGSGFTTVNTADTSLSAIQYASGGPAVENRGLLEYNLAPLTVGGAHRILSAVFIGQGHDAYNTSPWTVNFFGYSKSGNALAASDALLGTQVGTVTISPDTSLGNVQTVTLDTTFLNTAVNTTGYVGMNLRDPLAANGFGFASDRGGEQNPILRITFDPVPEASTVMIGMIGLGFGGILLRRRRAEA